MLSIETAENLIISTGYLKVDEIFPHEEVVADRLEKLIAYLESLKPYIIIPSILVCSESKMIIDGHHRYYALQSMGFNEVPVTFIYYKSPFIITDLDGKVSKRELLDAASSGNILSPKTSFHHVLCTDNKPHPIILLSTLYKLELTN